MSKTCRELKRPLDVTFVHAALQLTPPAPAVALLVIVTICYFALYHVLHAHREERKKKTWLGSLIATVPPVPFSPLCFKFPFFSFPYVFLFSFPLPCSFLDLSEEIRRRRDARNSAMSNISKREWKVGCPKIYSKSMIESCLWYHLGWQVDPLFTLLTLIEVIDNNDIFGTLHTNILICNCLNQFKIKYIQ